MNMDPGAYGLVGQATQSVDREQEGRRISVSKGRGTHVKAVWVRSH